jgi:hypothetical protein
VKVIHPKSDVGGTRGRQTSSEGMIPLGMFNGRWVNISKLKIGYEVLVCVLLEQRSVM